MRGTFFPFVDRFLGADKAPEASFAQKAKCSRRRLLGKKGGAMKGLNRPEWPYWLRIAVLGVKLAAAILGLIALWLSLRK